MSSRDDDPFSDPFSEASLRSHAADRNYPAEARRAAANYLITRRGSIWAAAVSGALMVALVVEIVIEPDHLTWSSSITIGLLAAALTQVIFFQGRMMTTRMWMTSLRRLVGFSPIPRDVSMTRYARATLAGEHAAGELETALVTLAEADEHSEPELAAARRVLTRHEVPDVSGEDYERRPESPFPWWNRHGVDAHEAPLPDVDHQCQPWVVAVTESGTEKATVVFRCPCGGLNYDGEGWGDRNRRRRTGGVASKAE